MCKDHEGCKEDSVLVFKEGAKELVRQGRNMKKMSPEPHWKQTENNL